MVDKDSLKLKEKMRKKRPDFLVKESKFSARVKSRWRFPRGKHSKVRQMHKGRQAMPSPGYGMPKEIKGLHKSGLEMVVVHNSKGLEALDAGKQGALIGSTVGQKKKLELLKLAKSKKITVLNVKDVNAQVEEIQKSFEKRTESRKKRQIELTKKEEEKKKKAEEKKKKDEEEKAKAKEAEKADSGEGAKSEKEEQKEMIEKTMTKRQ
ncbi:MAG: hypothetical protein KJ598_04930 [Nanoarchaeota archaeon]|nr:hypothetical protein [Nanoarchaeota archaeon]